MGLPVVAEVLRSHVGGRPPLVSVAEATAVGSAGAPALGPHTTHAISRIQCGFGLNIPTKHKP